MPFFHPYFYSALKPSGRAAFRSDSTSCTPSFEPRRMRLHQNGLEAIAVFSQYIDFIYRGLKMPQAAFVTYSLDGIGSRKRIRRDVMVRETTGLPAAVSDNERGAAVRRVPHAVGRPSCWLPGRRARIPAIANQRYSCVPLQKPDNKRTPRTGVLAAR